MNCLLLPSGTPDEKQDMNKQQQVNTKINAQQRQQIVIELLGCITNKMNNKWYHMIRVWQNIIFFLAWVSLFSTAQW